MFFLMFLTKNIHNYYDYSMKKHLQNAHKISFFIKKENGGNAPNET